VVSRPGESLQSKDQPGGGPRGLGISAGGRQSEYLYFISFHLTISRPLAQIPRERLFVLKGMFAGLEN
jgi:hypothetical protein